MTSPMTARMKKEIRMLEEDPPFGICVWPKDDRINFLEAQILGPEGTPYEQGLYKLEIEIPESYPFEPPNVKFITPIYHPNIDNAGRICLDTLKMPPKGSWLPSVNISTLLTTIRILMSEPNPDDGLMADVTEMYVQNYARFLEIAKEMTKKHAMVEHTFSSKHREGDSNQQEGSHNKENTENNKGEVECESCSSSSSDSSSDSESDESFSSEEEHPPSKKSKVGIESN